MARTTMTTPADIRDRLVAQRVVPVLRLASSDETERAVDDSSNMIIAAVRSGARTAYVILIASLPL